MKSLFIGIIVTCFTCSGCASERLQVTVTDSRGHPISNALVRVGTSTSHMIFGGGRRNRKSRRSYESRTDTNGIAVVKFNCQSSDFGWHVEADGYYRSESYRGHFKGEDVIIPPAFGYVILHEHEKEGRVTLWKKKNPQPMIAHGVGYEKDEHLVPRKNGRYGFDMMKYDWLPPLGKGEVADFYFIRRIGEEVDDGVWGWLEFSEKCGMYTGKQTGCKNFPSTYGADTNAVYKSRIPFIFDHADDGKKRITYKDIVNEDEYGVLRTRVVCDARGNIIKANYSKVLGPFRFGDWCGNWVILTRCAVFNPRVNDPNLESDPEHSYDPKVKRPLLAP